MGRRELRDKSWCTPDSHKKKEKPDGDTTGARSSSSSREEDEAGHSTKLMSTLTWTRACGAVCLRVFAGVCGVGVGERGKTFDQQRQRFNPAMPGKGEGRG